MIGLIANNTRIERIFWARPLPTVAMVAVFVGVSADVEHRIGEVHRRWRIVGVVGVQPVAGVALARGQQRVARRVVARKLLRSVLPAHTPGEAVMMSLAYPVELFRHVTIGAVLGGEKIAVRGEGVHAIVPGTGPARAGPNVAPPH